MEMKNDRGKGGGENDHDWMRIFFSFFLVIYDLVIS